MSFYSPRVFRCGGLFSFGFTRSFPPLVREKPKFFASNIVSTPPKINIEPENDDLEDDFPLPGVYSQVPC